MTATTDSQSLQITLKLDSQIDKHKLSEIIMVEQTPFPFTGKKEIASIFEKNEQKRKEKTEKAAKAEPDFEEKHLHRLEQDINLKADIEKNGVISEEVSDESNELRQELSKMQAKIALGADLPNGHRKLKQQVINLPAEIEENTLIFLQDEELLAFTELLKYWFNNKSKDEDDNDEEDENNAGGSTGDQKKEENATLMKMLTKLLKTTSTVAEKVWAKEKTKTKEKINSKRK